MEGADGELITDGLDGLRDRLSEYAELGAKFTKWRAVITIGQGIPTRRCIEANAHSLTRFALLSQEAGLVPIVEPEVLMDGDHDIETCLEVTTETLREVYYSLGAYGVALEGTLLKPNMVLSGKDASDRAGPDQVAEMTLRSLMNTVPSAVPGMVFLSGGQPDHEATVNLDAINRYAASCRAPWEVSFSYGRGLQASPLKVWGGEAGNNPCGAGGVLPSGESYVGRPAGRVHREDERGGGLSPADEREIVKRIVGQYGTASHYATARGSLNR